jgi:toxin CcdB
MMTTRVVVPLLPTSVLRPVNPRMNPVFAIEGRDYVLAVQGLQSVPVAVLGEYVISLLDHDTTIIGAIDALVSGI